jgi:hypothetical protein
MFPRVPPQIVRLVWVTIGIVASYFIAQHFLTPVSFKQYGWYRGKALVEVASATKPTFAGRKACEACHAEEAEKLAKGEHKTLSCEGCHGPGADHEQNPDTTKPSKLAFSHCVRCHEADPARPKWHKQISLKTHFAGQVCAECHVPHQPNEVP